MGRIGESKKDERCKIMRIEHMNSAKIYNESELLDNQPGKQQAFRTLLTDSDVKS